MLQAIYVFPTLETESDLIDNLSIPKAGHSIVVREESYLVKSVSDNTNMEGQHPIVTIYLEYIKPR